MDDWLRRLWIYINFTAMLHLEYPFAFNLISYDYLIVLYVRE